MVKVTLQKRTSTRQETTEKSVNRKGIVQGGSSVRENRTHGSVGEANSGKYSVNRVVAKLALP